MPDTQKLSEIRERCEKATPGPWVEIPQTDGSAMIAQEYETGKQMNPKGYMLVCHVMARRDSLPTDEANATLIAHARTDLPHTLALLDRCREMLEECHQCHGACATRHIMKQISALLAELKE